MPRQNRPLVRDGRLQSNKKKRTDRSYLGGTAQPRVEEQPVEEAPDEALPADATGQDAVEAEAPEAAAPAPAPPPAPASQPVSAPQPQRAGRLPSNVRALQQQGIRRRREFDVEALAERDTRYAYHELRRILILTSMVIVTLIVLGIVLR